MRAYRGLVDHGYGEQVLGRLLLGLEDSLGVGLEVGHGDGGGPRGPVLRHASEPIQMGSCEGLGHACERIRAVMDDLESAMRYSEGSEVRERHVLGTTCDCTLAAPGIRACLRVVRRALGPGVCSGRLPRRREAVIGLRRTSQHGPRIILFSVIRPDPPIIRVEASCFTRDPVPGKRRCWCGRAWRRHPSSLPVLSAVTGLRCQ